MPKIGMLPCILISHTLIGDDTDGQLFHCFLQVGRPGANLSDAPHKNYRKLHVLAVLALSHIDIFDFKNTGRADGS